MKTPTTITLAAALLLSAAATPALADAGAVVRLHVADIDPTSHNGQVALDRRIDRVARLMCDTANERFGNAVRAQQRACRQQIDASARIEIARRPTNLTSR